MSKKAAKATPSAPKIVVARYDLKTKKAADVPDYEKVVLDLHHDLSPSVLKKDGLFLTNIWEFSKVYPKVKEQKQTWWNHVAETHITGSKIEKEYWNWRDKGMKFNHPIRFSNDSQNRNKYQNVIKLCETELDVKSAKNTVSHGHKTYEVMDHVDARVKLVYATYLEAIKKEKAFTELKA